MSHSQASLLIFFLFATAVSASVDYGSNVKPALEKHCANCHNADKHKGGVDLSGFTDNLSVIKDRKLWLRVLEQVEGGDMP